MYKDLRYIQTLFIHLLLGFIIYQLKFLSLVYGLLVLFFGIFWIWQNRNQNEEALLVCAYFMGMEVFLRMTKGAVNHEFVKYSIMLLLLFGMFFKGFSKNAIPYWIFILILIPGLIQGLILLSGHERLRQTLMFNISGPLCLAISSLYCYNRKINFNKLLKVFYFAGMPIVSCAIYLLLYVPDLKDVITGTGSNFSTSGGFGPNQVATILGLGLFLFFSRALFASPTRLQFFINIGISLFLTYRALLTFSRGGLITGLFMVVLLISVVLFRGNSSVRLKVSSFVILVFGGLLFVWLYTVLMTGGLIEKRYSNQDALGREKESVLTGREEVALTEINLFLEKPIFGGGVGSGFVYRKEYLDITMASHNEITRMLGEHGLFGIIGLLLLIFTPLILYLDNKNHFFLLCLLAFWFLTLNHAAMRTAAPAFVYALTLLKIQLDDQTIVPWKRLFK
ncbi:MAG: O-antigen ligase family protein, partial [Flavobacterium sp.]